MNKRLSSEEDNLLNIAERERERERALSRNRAGTQLGNTEKESVGWRRFTIGREGERERERERE